MLRNPLLIPDLRMLLREGESDGLREFFAEFHPASSAEILQDLEADEAESIFGLLDDRVRAAVMSYLEHDEQVRVIERLTTHQAAELLHWMPHDDRADLVNRLDEDRAEEILRGLAQADREDIRRLISYEPGTAGSVMTTDYVALPPQITVREAIDQLRREAPDRETIDYSYVIDPRRQLIGSVSLKRLILARPSMRIEDIMDTDLIVARVDEDQESVARKIQDYDLVAIPVVDANAQLVGIVTHDDALDILRQEQTEDILAFGGVAAGREADEDSYWQGRVVESVRRRIGWLLFLFFGGTITSFVVTRFAWVEGRVSDPAIQLDVFIPLLIGTGGNAGSQAVGTIIRGLALGEIGRGDAWRVLWREWLTGTLLGVLLGGLGFLYTMFVLGNPPAFSTVIAFAILGICMWANCVGALVPLLAKRLGIDPAVVSAPLISTLVDATGLVIYYTIAILVLVRIVGRT